MRASDSDYAGAYAERGVCIVEYALGPADIAALETLVTYGRHSGSDRLVVSDGTQTATIANALGTLQTLAGTLLGAEVRAVSAIAVDDTPDANWFVPWHQDHALRCATRAGVSADRSRTRTGASAHTQRSLEHLTGLAIEPATELAIERAGATLLGMITLRVALDASVADTGPMEVIPGSHRQGVLTRSQIDALVDAAEPKVCLTERGDILAMSPLLVHRTQRAHSPLSQRVVHVEFLRTDLGAGLPVGLARAN